MKTTETYQARRQEIDAQLAKLQELLKQLDAKQALEPTNWGIVGSAGHIGNGLEDILECFGK